MNQKLQWLSQLEHSSHIGILVVDKERNNLFVNNRLCKMFGYDKETLLASSAEILHVNHDSFLKFADLAFNTVLNGKPLSIDYEVKHSDGSHFWLHISGEPIENSDEVLWTFHDMTNRKLLELELEESYKTLHKLTENVPGAIYQYRLFPDGRATFPYISNGMRELYEIATDELLNDATPAFNRIHADDLEYMITSIKDSAETMKNWDVEYRVDLPKKGVRWLEGRARPEKLQDGSILWHGYIQDITDDKRKEEALVLSNKRFEHAELVGNVGSWEYNIQTKEYWGSTHAKRIYGGPQDTTLFSEEIVESCMTEAQRVHDALVDLIENGTEYNLEYEITPLDGSKPKILASIGTVELDDSKKPLKVTGFLQDITEKKHTLGLLEQKKQELEIIIQNAPNPIMIHNEEGEVILINQVWEDLTGYSHTEINTIEKWTQNAYAEKMSVVKKYIDTLHKLNHKVDEGEFSVKTKNGDTLIWQFSSAPLGEIDGKRTVISSAMDITELKKKDEMLLAQSRHAAMGEMIGMIAHQWRQPLSVISMNANNMLVDIELDEFDVKEAQKVYLDTLDQTQHLSKTIDDFRNFFKPDKEILEVILQMVLEETYSIVQDSLKNNNINFKTSFETDGKVPAYPRELMQVFVNIINNAKDAIITKSIKDGFIHIRVYNDGDYVITEICDNAKGVDASILDKIFDPYFSTKGDKNGTGLGLYMSKMIIEDHLHGKLEVSNTDSGACFRVSLHKELKD